MKLIFGGAYQGKLDFALELTGLGRDDACYCEAADLSFQPIIYGLESWVLAQIKSGSDPVKAIESELGNLKGKTLIITDMSCGVVPMDAEQRKWREACGRVSSLLAKHADEVYRVFCGIGTKIKPMEKTV